MDMSDSLPSDPESHSELNREYPESDRLILEFERSWWMNPGIKSAQIRARFGMSPPRYYRRLTEIMDNPTAQKYDPMTVKRLLRARLRRRTARFEVNRAHPSAP